MPHKLIQKPYRDGHLQLAASGHARQLVIFAHGGWKAADGQATVRPTNKVFYYVPDATSTVGHTLFNDIVDNSGLAYLGRLVRAADMTLGDAQNFIQNNPNADVKATMLRVKDLNQPVVETAKGGTVTSNYAVYKHPDGAGKIQKCLAGEIDDDIDIAINLSDHKCHLSDFFDLCQSNSVAHHVIHFVACRSAR